MRCLIVHSWPNEIIVGTGTVRLIRCLKEVISTLGHSVLEAKAPPINAGPRVRRTFDDSLMHMASTSMLDCVIGIDYDGYVPNGWSVPYIAVAAAMFADIACHENESEREHITDLAQREHQAFKGAHRVIAPSAYVRKRVQELHGVANDKVSIVTPFLQMESWAYAVPRARSSLERVEDRVLAMGRFYRRKRLDLLLRSFARVRVAMPGAMLRIIGDGPLRGEWEALSNQLGLSGSVHWLGAVTDDSILIDEWARAKVFAHSSLQECFGFVLLESRVSLTPAVAFAAASAPEVAAPETVWAEPGDWRALADAIVGSLRAPRLVTNPGAARADSALAVDQMTQCLRLVGL